MYIPLSKPSLPVLHLGSLQLDQPILLAPLASITDSPFRRLCRRKGAAMVFTEMVSAAGLVRNARKTWDLARFQADERPLSVQIFGSDPVVLAEAARRLEELEPDALDLNFGCPMRKITKTGAGAAFLEDPIRIGEAVHQVVQVTRLPVTVKLRSGPKSSQITAVEAARIAELEGAVAITVHARTTEQGFRGKADWSVIAQVKQAVKIPVIGNGDVNSPEDMFRLLEQTCCDGVMIGRAALGNPWLFSACQAVINGTSWVFPTPTQVWEDLQFHFQEMLEQKGRRGLREMRKHWGWYSKQKPGAAQFRAKIFRIDDPEEVRRWAEQFFLQQDFTIVA